MADDIKDDTCVALPSATAYKIACGRWLLGQAKREAMAGLPRLRAIPGDRSISLLEVIEPWPQDKQEAMLRGLVKRSFDPGPNPQSPSPFSLNGEEAWAVQQFGYPVTCARALQAVSERQRNGEFSLPKGALKRAMTKRMKALLGAPARQLGGEIDYLTQTAGVTVWTTVDFGSSRAQVVYSQQTLTGAIEQVPPLCYAPLIGPGISIMKLAGTTSTKWSYLTPEGIPAAADLLGQLCIEFIEAVPGIIEDARTLTM